MRVARSGRRQQALPAELTSFVGRRRELAEVKQLLAGSRLLTLSGPGGVGKTRLALRAALELGRAFPDGAWLAELAALEDPTLVANAVAQSLGLRADSGRWLPATLSECLAEKQLLLVLDNCEHLLDATAVLAETLLRAAPGLRILATSREVLGIAGEANFVVPSLSLPDIAQVPSPERLVQFEAITLFDELARAINPSFRLTAENSGRVIELCRRLDGIPLAIELAAVRLRMLSLDELVGRLNDQFLLLTQGSRTALPRQQTLKATIDWSWQLLTERERVLWRRLSVFAGEFDLDAVEAVCADESLPSAFIFESLASLMDKSIISRIEVHSRARYTMLETLRQFARDRAADADEIEWLSARHLAWFAKICDQAASADAGSAIGDWVDRLDAELGNLRVAFEAARQRTAHAETGVLMIAGTWRFWQSRGHNVEARHWLGLLMAQLGATSAARLRGLGVLAWMELSLGAADDARRWIAEGLSLSEKLDDREGLAILLIACGQLAIIEDDFGTAVRSLSRAADLFRDVGLDGMRAATLAQLAAASMFAADDLVTAERVAEEAIALAARAGNAQVRAQAEMALGWDLIFQKQFARAETVFKSALTSGAFLITRWNLGQVLEGLAFLADAAKRPERAAQIVGVVDGVWDSARPSLPAKLQRIFAELRTTLESKLGREQFERIHELGRAMSVSDGVALALEGAVGRVARPAATSRPSVVHGSVGGLSRRELEVASLVARGMSNKEIASKLVLSERTIDHHVAHILDKLGFNSRSQVAAWAAAPALVE